MKKIVFFLLTLGVLVFPNNLFAFHCICICTPVDFTMKISTKFGKKFIKKWDDRFFTETFGKKIARYIHQIRKKKEEIKEDYKRKWILLKYKAFLERKNSWYQQQIEKVPIMNMNSLIVQSENLNTYMLSYLNLLENKKEVDKMLSEIKIRMRSYR